VIERAALAYADTLNAAAKTPRRDRLFSIDDNPLSVENLVREGFVVVRRLHESLRWPDDDKPRGKAKPSPEDRLRRGSRLWSHRPYLAGAIKRKRLPFFYRSSVEDAVATYLKLPYRAREIDRMLVDILIAMEIAAFVDEMEYHFWLKWRAVKSFAQLAFNILFWMGALFVAQRLNFISETWANAGYFWIAMLGAPPIIYAWGRPTAREKDIDEKIEQMLFCYNALNSDAVISAPHVRELLAIASTQKRIVWPAPLLTLLDDVMARGGKL
jgi:hypothetical protein